VEGRKNRAAQTPFDQPGGVAALLQSHLRDAWQGLAGDG